MTPIAGPPAGIHPLMDSLAAVKIAAKSMTAAGFGWRRQDNRQDKRQDKRENKRQAWHQREGRRSIADRACHIEFSRFVTLRYIARLTAESRQPDFTFSRVFDQETSLILRKVG
jgi:hypothetical protein